MNFEIAVNQVWRECAEDCECMCDDVEIVAVTDSEVCAKYTDGGLCVFNHSDFRREHTLIKHQDGQPAEPELPYVDCKVYERISTLDGDTKPIADSETVLVYDNAKNETVLLGFASSRKGFIGYVYDDGELLHLPRFYVGPETPAQTPTHVRFAR